MGVAQSRLALAQFALTMPIIIPSQVEQIFARQMPSNHVEDVAAEWAGRDDVRVLLQKLLDRPYDEVPGVASVHPFGGLLDRHLVQLDALASNLETHFKVTHSSHQFTMHVWLYHLLGGRQAGLTAPTADKRAAVTKGRKQSALYVPDAHSGTMMIWTSSRGRLPGGQPRTRDASRLVLS